MEQVKKKKGFALLTKEARMEASRKGGLASHAQGKGHKFTTETGRAARKLRDKPAEPEE